MANVSRIAEADAPRRRAILVCGMHRSGTSALAGALRLLGVTAPKTLLPVHSSNPRGHWESAPLVDLFEAMLAEAGSSHLDWRAIDQEWFNSESADRYRLAIKNVIMSEFEGSSLFFIKDPRICRFMPFMLRTIEELDIQPHIVLPLRNPLEVAKSLARRNGLPIAESMLIWLRHVLEAEYHSRSLPRAFLEYHLLVTDWRATLKPVFEKIGMTWLVPEAIPDRKVDEFLEPGLRHENISLNDLQTNEDTTVWVKQAYEYVVQLSQGKQEKTILNDLSNLKNDFDIACKAFDLDRNDQIQRSAIEAYEGAKPADQILALDRELRSAVAETESRARRLITANDDLHRVTGELAQRDRRLAALDGDLRRLASEVEDRDRRLAMADGDLRRLMGELEGRERRLETADADLRRLTGEVENRERRLETADADLRRLVGEVENRERRLEAADADLRRLMEQVDDRERRLEAADRDLRRVMCEVKNLDQQLRGLIVEMGNRDQQLVAANDDQHRLIREINDRDQRLQAAHDELGRIAEKAELDRRHAASVVAERDQQLGLTRQALDGLVEGMRDRDQRLLALERRLREIEMSTTWRMTAPIRKLLSGWRRALFQPRT